MNASTAPEVDFSVWEARWQALNSSIENYKGRLKRSSNPCVGILSDMLESLQKFADVQFHFFYEGFTTDAACKLKPSQKYPPEYVLGVTLKQVGYDLEVIQRAAEQRIWSSSSKDVRTTLAQADALANKALEWVYASPNINVNRPKVITYFEKSPSVRFFPYAELALIAIPFTCLRSTDGFTQHHAQDYAPLLHELGHYIFWYGKVTNQDKKTPIHKVLNKKLLSMKDVAPWCYRWIEEIFADVFGCIIGGPVIALSAQDLALVTSEREFVKDDGEHPVPAIRPRIYTFTLSKLESSKAHTRAESKSLRQQLEERWQTRYEARYETKQRQNPAASQDNYVQKSSQVFNEPATRGEQSKVSEEPIDQNLSQITANGIDFTQAANKVEGIVDVIFSDIFGNNITPGELYNESECSTSPDGLYQCFKEYIDRLLPTNEQQSGSAGEPVFWTDKTDWESWVNTNEFLADPLSLKSTTEPISSGEEKTETQGWLNILYAGGWATKGPTSNPSVKEDPQ